MIGVLGALLIITALIRIISNNKEEKDDLTDFKIDNTILSWLYFLLFLTVLLTPVKTKLYKNEYVSAGNYKFVCANEDSSGNCEISQLPFIVGVFFNSASRFGVGLPYGGTVAVNELTPETTLNLNKYIKEKYGIETFMSLDVTSYPLAVMNYLTKMSDNISTSLEQQLMDNKLYLHPMIFNKHFIEFYENRNQSFVVTLIENKKSIVENRINETLNGTILTGAVVENYVEEHVENGTPNNSWINRGKQLWNGAMALYNSTKEKIIQKVMEIKESVYTTVNDYIGNGLYYRNIVLLGFKDIDTTSSSLKYQDKIKEIMESGSSKENFLKEQLDFSLHAFKLKDATTPTTNILDEENKMYEIINTVINRKIGEIFRNFVKYSEAPGTKLDNNMKKLSLLTYLFFQAPEYEGKESSQIKVTKGMLENIYNGALKKGKKISEVIYIFKVYQNYSLKDQTQINNYYLNNKLYTPKFLNIENIDWIKKDKNAAKFNFDISNIVQQTNVKNVLDQWIVKYENKAIHNIEDRKSVV